MKTKITLSLTGLLVSFLAPLAILVPQASAAADTCTWTGLGTGVEDTVAKTWTFDVSDVANWTGCDNGTLPEDGDMLVFPANLAVVDPLNANSDDYSWQYVVNDDLVANTNFAGMQFTGNTGTDCSVYDDRYIFSGNAISLSGDITNDATGNCNYNGGITLSLDITTTTGVSIEAVPYAYVSGTSITSKTITYGANALNFCDPLDTSPMSNFSMSSYSLAGTGDITLSCGNNNFSPLVGSTFGDIIVAKGSLSTSSSTVGSDPTKTVTFKDNTYFFLNDSAVAEFKSNIVFEGSVPDSFICKTNDYTACNSDTSLQTAVKGQRVTVYNSTYNNTTQKSTYNKSTISGDITLSGNTTFSLSSDLAISGAIVGNYNMALQPGSRGKLIIESSANGSNTANSTITSEKVSQDLVDPGYDLYVSYGYVSILQADEEITHKITVYEGGTLKGIGKAAGIDVQTGATLAPGNSPGCIVSNGDLTLNGSYDVEIAGNTVCTQYDQTDVTGAVDVTGATLNIAMLDNFIPKLNDTFTIIKNDLADAVAGEFTGLAEGASIEVSGITYKISYKGGDGNDVVLTATDVSVATAAAEKAAAAATATPTTPKTGVGQIIQSPIMTLVALVLSAGMLFGIKRIQSAK